MPNFNLSFKEAVDFAESRKVVLPDEYYSSTMKGRATTVSGLASLSQIERVVDELNKTLKEGRTLADFKQRVANGDFSVDLPSYRLDTVFRTNIQAAYNFGRWQQQEIFKDSRPYLMYDAVNDTRTRPTHAELDNTILPHGDSFWATHYPPLGFNCRCTVISLTRSQAEARGITKERPNVDPDEGFGFNVAQFKQSLSKIVEDKMTDLELKFAASSKSLALIQKNLLNDEIAMEKVNSLASEHMIVGPVKDQYMNILATLGTADSTIGQLPVRLLNEYIQSGSEKIKSFLKAKSQVSSDLIASSFIKQAFQHIERIATNKTAVVLRGIPATDIDSALSTFSVGSVVRLLTPTSFSKDENTATRYASVGGLIFHFEKAKGYGIDVVKAGGRTLQVQREQEVIMTPDTNVKVDRIEKTADGVTHVYASITTEDFTKEY